MTDHFSVLGFPRSPWLDAEQLKERFHRLGALHHPDAPEGSSEAFAAANAAWQVLREPAGCLRHFLELKHPGALADAAKIPPGLADLFMDIAAFRESAQKFLAKRADASSPLAKALLEPERIAIRTGLEALAANVEARTTQAIASVRLSDATPAQLATALSSLVFLGKWAAQLAELRLGL